MRPSKHVGIVYSFSSLLYPDLGGTITLRHASNTVDGIAAAILSAQWAAVAMMNGAVIEDMKVHVSLIRQWLYPAKEFEVPFLVCANGAYLKAWTDHAEQCKAIDQPHTIFALLK